MPLTDVEFVEELRDVLPLVKGYARKLTGTNADAEDLVQEATCNAWNSRERFRNGTSFKAWMCTIIRNRFLSDARRAKWTGEMPADYEPSAPPNQFFWLRAKEVAVQIERMSANHRNVLLLAADGASYEEAAKAMDCEIGTVKSRLSRARRALTQMS